MEAESEPFYMPDPNLFGHSSAYPLFTGYASQLFAEGLAQRFPTDPDVRKVAIELLAERYPVETLLEDPSLIADAIVEACAVLEERESPSQGTGTN
jgi:hypothetical protein